MKSERRHELQHNELAEWLFKTGEQVKPYQNLLLALAAAVVVAIVGYSWWVRHATTRTNQAWTELNRAMEAGSPEMLANVAEEYPNTVAGQTADALLGDIRLFTSCNQRFASSTIAQRELKAAQECYSKILDANISETLRERATFGMARVKETDGKLDAAKQLYSDIVAEWPDGAYAAAAKRRLADFKEPETKLMFTDLRKYEPKGEFAEEPGAFAPSPPTSPPTFDVPQEPPVRNQPDDVRKGVKEPSERPLSDDLGKGLEELPTAPVGIRPPDALGNALIAEPEKSPTGSTGKSKADAEKKAGEKSGWKKKTDAQPKKQ